MLAAPGVVSVACSKGLAMSSISPVATSSLHASNAKPLMKAADGDYTAASVAANPGSTVGMVKQADGDYRPMTSAAAQSSSAVQAALSTLKKGG
jgi:hypothetical protein